MAHAILGAHEYANFRSVAEFQKIRSIAHGEFGCVYKVKDMSNGELYALKKLRLPDFGPDSTQELPQNVLHQINYLKVMKHINIVNLREVVVGINPQRYLLLDLCEYSLERIIEEVDAVFLQQHHIKYIMHQILAGVNYIHRFNVVHRDLCPKNILFTETGILKIGDFVSARTAGYVGMTPDHGIYWYRPPEILLGNSMYTKAVDVWSIGCIFGEMLLRKPLFIGCTERDIRGMLELLGSPSKRNWPGFSNIPALQHYRLKKKEIFAVLKNQTRATLTYLKKFLQYNPASRPSVEEVMEDRYYVELPHDCPHEVLMLTLQQSRKL